MTRGLIQRIGASVLALCCGAAGAATCTSTATGNWNQPSIWSGCGGGVPGTGDTANIANLNHTVTVSDNRTVNVLNVVAGGNYPNLTIAASVTFNVNNTMTVNGASGGSGTRRVTVGAGAILNVGNDLVMNGGSSNTRDTELLLADGAATAVNVTGDFGATAAGGNFNSTVRMFITFSGNGTIAIGRNFGGNATLTSGTGTIVANGSVNQSLGAYNAVASNYHNLTISKTGGTATFAGNVRIRGNITDNGNFDPASGNRTVTLAGSAAQNLLGSAAGTTFYRVTLVNGNGLTLAHDLNITNLLTLTTGHVTTGASRVFIQNGSAISSAGGADFVVGNLAKNYTAGGNISRVFEVGSLTGGARYAPLNIRFGSVTTAGDFTVSTTAGDHPGIGGSTIDPLQSVNRYWTLTAGSVVFAANGNNRVIFTFVAADLDGGAATGSFYVSRYNAPTWTEITPSARAATTTTISGAGITTGNIAGEYQIGELAPVVPAPGDFNAFETGTVANAITGRIFTKLAGANFAVDIVAILAGAQQATFTDTVGVQLIANTTGAALGVDNCPTTFTTVQTVSPDPTITGGRSTVGFAAVATAYRDVRVRVQYPVGSPTVTGCSTDNFSIRPQAFSSVTSNLNNAGTTGTPVARAGDLFTLDAAAEAGYNGTPVINNTQIVAHAGAIQTGTLGGTFSAANPADGTATGAAFTYSEVGNFYIDVNGVYDNSFTAVDTPGTDCTSDFSNAPDVSGRYGCSFGNSSQTDVIGRFTPDHFDVALNTPTFAPACAAGGFTYAGQPFDYTVQPVITVTAENSGNTTTQNYQGSWWKITSGSLTGKSYTALDGSLDTSGVTGTDPLIRYNGDGGGAGEPAAGDGSLSFSSGTGLFFTRSTPVAPFDAEISLTINVIDADGVAYSTNPARFGQATAGNGIAFSTGNEMRFGRLRVIGASGSQLLPLQVSFEAQYWTGTFFATNTADTCTTVGNGNVGLGNYIGNLNAGDITVTAVTDPLTAGRGEIDLSAPGAGNNGSVDLAINLGTGPNAAACPAFAPVAAPGALAHLRGQWCGAAYDRDPATRLRFGIRSGSDERIYMRENY